MTKEILEDYVKIYKESIKENQKKIKANKLDAERMRQLVMTNFGNKTILKRIEERLEEFNEPRETKDVRKDRPR